MVEAIVPQHELWRLRKLDCNNGFSNFITSLTPSWPQTMYLSHPTFDFHIRPPTICRVTLVIKTNTQRDFTKKLHFREWLLFGSICAAITKSRHLKYIKNKNLFLMVLETKTLKIKSQVGSVSGRNWSSVPKTVLYCWFLLRWQTPYSSGDKRSPSPAIHFPSPFLSTVASITSQMPFLLVSHH